MATPPFFRYSYFMAHVGYSRGFKVVTTVHGYVFTFYRPQEWVKALVKQRVKEIMVPLEKEITTSSIFDFPDGVVADIDVARAREEWYEAEEEEQVDVEEVRGVGFYYPRILINDIESEKADIRYRLWRTILSFVSGVIRGIVGK